MKALFLAIPLAVAGCGYNCQSTCFRIYDPSECAVVIAGVQSSERIRDCITECENALDAVGPMGTYDPNSAGGTSRHVLQNERQAAEWMDCVWAAECTELDPVAGVCHPI